MSEKEVSCCKKTSIGGQALMEGIMMRGPYKSALAMRRASGKIEVETKEIGKPKWWSKVPILRGPFVFIRSMSVGTSALMRSAEAVMEDELAAIDKEDEEQETPDLESMTARERKKYEKALAKKEKEKEKARKEKEKLDAKIAELDKEYESKKTAIRDDFAAKESRARALLASKTDGVSEEKAAQLTRKTEAVIASERAKVNQSLSKLRKEHSDEVAAWKRGEGGFSGVIVGISTVLGFGLAVLLFFFLPTWCYTGLMKILPQSAVDYFSSNSVWQSAFEGVLKLIIFVVYVKLATLMDETKRLFMYHGAEHKTIFCYEAGEELTVENVRKYRRFHPRCGTSFLIIMMVIGIIVGIFIPRTIPYAALLRPVIKLLIIPLTMGVGYELLKLCGRFDNILTRIVAAPGLLMQRLTTSEPDDGQIECAIEALKAVIPEDGSDQW